MKFFLEQKELTQMILPSEHLRAVRTLKWGLARVLADMVYWNLYRRPHIRK